MSEIKEILDKILDEINTLQKLSTEPDEFVIVTDIEIAIHEARKVFERTKNINN